MKKEGKNQGKVFYHCGRKKPDNCKFWKWEDQIKKTSGKPEKKEVKESSDEEEEKLQSKKEKRKRESSDNKKEVEAKKVKK